MAEEEETKLLTSQSSGTANAWLGSASLHSIAMHYQPLIGALYVKGTFVLVSRFNKEWEKERDKIEKQLTEKLETEIKLIDRSMRNSSGRMKPEIEQDLTKMRNEIRLRQALVIYESEDIARNRMQLRASYLALVMSSLALIISLLTIVLKS